MDSYQAIYDAVRSKISNGDIGQAVQNALSNADLGHYVAIALQDVSAAGYEHQRPSAVYRPTLSNDGDTWRALYGENLAVGCVGFGDSPADAMRAFDDAWNAKSGTRDRSHDPAPAAAAGGSR
jgi:hypothetical protein